MKPSHEQFSLVNRQPLPEQISPHEAAMWLAYGFFEGGGPYHAWLARNGEVTSHPDQPEPNDTPLIDAYWRESERIRVAARDGAITLFGRPPLSVDDPNWYPHKFGDYAAIPAAVFIQARIAFSPTEEGGLYLRDGTDDSPFLARWFKVTLTAADVQKLVAIDKSGGQSFAGRDNPLIEEMRALILAKKAKSAHAAAAMVVDKAPRLGSEESAIERLKRAYGRRYPLRQRRR